MCLCSKVGVTIRDGQGGRTRWASPQAHRKKHGTDWDIEPVGPQITQAKGGAVWPADLFTK